LSNSAASSARDMVAAAAEMAGFNVASFSLE
jgi:hypothetical protein